MSDYIKHPAFPFISPFFLYILLSYTDGFFGEGAYLVKDAIRATCVFLLILWLWPRLPSLKPKHILGSIGVGTLGIVMWIGLYPWLTIKSLDPATGFDPYALEHTDIALGVLFFRFFGSSVVVPIMEEVFWRGFLMRYLINEDFEKEPLARYTAASFWITTAAIVMVHADQYGVAFIYGALMGWWFLRTKSVGDAVLAHAVSNLLLNIWVIATGTWYFWPI